MEAAVASGILKIVGNKLAPLLMEEYSSIVGAKKDLQMLHGQVMEINNWLECVGDKVVGNDPSFNWLKELKNVAYEVDDIVDEFQLMAEKHDSGGDGGIMSKYLCNKPKSIIFQCKVATKIKAIKKKFAAIVKQRNDFSAITKNLPVGHPPRHMNITVGEMPLLPNVDASVLGREKDKHELISELVEVKDHQIINIVSIIGLGGSGKTTLAKLVFNDGNTIDKHFEVKLWVHVSQDFDVVELVRKLFEAIAGEKSEQYPLQEMSKKISDSLTRKRYLVVLDDVWTKDQPLWDQFMVHLKSGTPGSAILLTMRSSDVAEIVRSTYQFSLPFLSLGDSWALFQQSLGMPVKHLESEFLEVGKEIVNKCGGVPIAIKAIAGVLRGKELIGEWQGMRDSNLLDVEGEEASVSVSRCLRLSYFHLPSHMKQCFTICAVIPKGHMIDKEHLIDQWIAHDMITPEAGVEYLEDTGHKYFNYLVQMSFLQDVTEKNNGRMECRMHDLVHDLALSILDDKISLVVPKEATTSAKSCRYFSLTEQPKNMAPKKFFRKARAVYMSWYGDYTNVMALKHAKHLRSVMVEYLDEEEANIMSQAKYLKYFSMPSGFFKTLPDGISDVWSLQALHLTDCYSLVKIPESIGKLRKLRTLNLLGCQELKHLPESIGNCQMISSIDLSYCIRLTMLPDSIGRNEKLRVLRLSSTKIERLPSSITTLRNLECLNLQDCQELVELPEGIGNLGRLQILNLNGCTNLGGMPVGIGQLSRLQRLGLFVVGKGEESAGISELANVSRIGENLRITGIQHVMDTNDAHVACLKQKTNLQMLNLKWMAETMEDVNTELQQDVLDGLEPPPGIKMLNICGYSGRQYARWMQSQVGGEVQGPSRFPFLREMCLCDLPNLKHLDGFVELPCLEVLELQHMPCLESISGGPFPSLVKLQMVHLPCLGEVWMIPERTMPDVQDVGGCYNYNLTPHLGQVRVGSCLIELEIEHCPKLEVMPHLPPSLQCLTLNGSEKVLQSPGQCHGSLSPSFNKLKKLKLWGVTGLGFGHGWELLQHMAALESLKIYSFYGVQTDVPESLWSLTSLRSLSVSRWSNIRMLPESLGELRSLEELVIEYCNSLTSLPQSMGQLCSLRELVIISLPALTCFPQSMFRLTTSLQELEISRCPAIKSLPQGMEGLVSLERLEINHCPGLTSLPQEIEGLVSLKQLSIIKCKGLTSLPQGMKGLVSLEWLGIKDCPGLMSLPQEIEGLVSLKQLLISKCKDLTSLPQGMKGLISLERLRIYDCPGLMPLPQEIEGLVSLKQLLISKCKGLTSLPQGMKGLVSIERLEIKDCPALTSLPQEIEGLVSLKQLLISKCKGLTSLPQGMKGLVSLEELYVRSCPEIKSLPEGIKDLTALKELKIFGCPDLGRRCKKGTGEDWHLISHIPRVSII